MFKQGITVRVRFNDIIAMCLFLWCYDLQLLVPVRTILRTALPVDVYVNSADNDRQSLSMWSCLVMILK